MLVELPAPFDFALTIERFARFGDDLANRVVDGALHRVLAGEPVRIASGPGGATVDPGHAGLAPTVRRLLGGDVDLGAFAAAVADDPVLPGLVRDLAGLRPALVLDPFEMLVTAISAQQVSLLAATAIRSRLIARFGTAHGLVHAFPARELVAGLPEQELLAVGFSRAKARAIAALARSDLDLDGLAALPDAEVEARLTALPGIGRWTAEWFLARHLGRLDLWPAGDLALRRAAGAFYLGGRDPDEREARALGERFRPFRSLAALYLLVGMRVRAR